MTITELDVLRVALIVIACITLLLMVLRARRARLLKGDRFTTWATSSLAIFTLFAVFVGIRQFGHPVHVWWVLPMLGAGSTCALIALTKSKI